MFALMISKVKHTKGGAASRVDARENRRRRVLFLIAGMGAAVFAELSDTN